jgi:hypothetical protein
MSFFQKLGSKIGGIAKKGISETETTDYLYLKSWSKLTQIHKVIKICPLIIMKI